MSVPLAVQDGLLVIERYFIKKWIENFNSCHTGFIGRLEDGIEKIEKDVLLFSSMPKDAFEYEVDTWLE